MLTDASNVPGLHKHARIWPVIAARLDEQAGEEKHDAGSRRANRRSQQPAAAGGDDPDLTASLERKVANARKAAITATASAALRP